LCIVKKTDERSAAVICLSDDVDQDEHTIRVRAVRGVSMQDHQVQQTMTKDTYEETTSTRDHQVVVGH
jgi:hypothetical protein